MRRNGWFLVIVWLLSCARSEAWTSPTGEEPPAASGRQQRSSDADLHRSQVEAFLTKYCTACHGRTQPKARLDLSTVPGEAEMRSRRRIWGRVREYVDGGIMPPEDRPQPTAEESARLTAWIKTALERDNCGRPGNPGRVTIRRLNRAEYNNTIRDLVGVDFRPADDFPADDVGYGFDNIGDVLSLPPLLMERYLAAAERSASGRSSERRTGGRRTRCPSHTGGSCSASRHRRASIRMRPGPSWSGSRPEPIVGRSHPGRPPG